MTLVTFLLCASPAWTQSRGTKKAAAAFEQGEKLYNSGQFTAAIRAFGQANELAPHFRSLFNIARCYENLADPARALEFYGKALDAPGIDPPSQADVQQRMNRLRSRPAKVFVSSQPSGARVTVDGKANPEPGTTPLVLNLTPGEHVMLVSKADHLLVARRIVVEMDRELPVEVELKPVALPCPPPAAPCPRSPPCPKPRSRVDLHRVHVHLHLLGAFGWTPSRPVAGGPGVQLHITYRRLVFGGHLLGLPMGQEDVTGELGDIVKLENRTFFWLVGVFEGGYSFPFDNFYLYTTAALGVSADRVVFRGSNASGKDDSISKENFAATWSLGGGIEAMATRWLSLGGAIRLGMIHGKRVAKDDPGRNNYEEVNLPCATLWGNVTLRL